jgi:ParB-like chromosome segregation protein Spo0J
MTDDDETVHIKDLQPDPTNRRARTERSAAMIARSLQTVGCGRSVLIDESNRLIAGNGVVDGCAEIGITKVRIIDASGDELIAVRRSDLSDEQKRAAALYDNRTAELSTWVPEQLAADVAQGLDLTPFFTAKELAKVTTVPVTLPVTPATPLAKTMTCPSCGHTFHPI